jgi:hypothetical protein
LLEAGVAAVGVELEPLLGCGRLERPVDGDLVVDDDLSHALRLGESWQEPSGPIGLADPHRGLDMVRDRAHHDVATGRTFAHTLERAPRVATHEVDQRS